MTTYISPAHSNIATPLDWGTATMEDLWRASDLAGIPAGAILRSTHQLLGGHPKLGS